MFADALASEAYKLWRNRTVWFWGFVFVPLVGLAIQLFTDTYLRSRMQGAGAMLPPFDLGSQALGSLAKAAGPFTQLFALLAAAVLFGGEYRWETWRLLAPRNSRLNLMLAKVGIFAAGTAFTVIALALAAVLSNLIGAAASHGALAAGATPPGTLWLGLLQQFLISWAQLLQLGAIAALAAVVTRSIIAAVIAPIVLGVVQLAMNGIPQADPMHPPIWRLLALPGLSADLLRAYFVTRARGQDVLEPGVAAQAGISLVGWIVVVLAVALVAFQRQDLSKE